MQEDERRQFEQALLPHMAAAYNLARWLMRDEQEAEDVLQEAYLRALKSFAGFRGSDGKGWLLMIVRNNCYTRLRRRRARGATATFDEEIHGVQDHAPTPAALAVRKEEGRSVRQALNGLPEEFREVVILRELEGLTYKEIAAVADVSIGTVMSRLSRGRALLHRRVAERLGEES